MTSPLDPQTQAALNRMIVGGATPPLVSDTVREFLQQRQLDRPLRKPPEEVLASTLTAPVPSRSPEEQEILRIQAKFNAYSLKDKGVMAQMASEFLRPRQQAMEARTGGALLWDGLNLWFELAIHIGLMHSGGQSVGLTRSRVMATFDRLREITEHAEQRIEARVLQLVNDQLVHEVARLDGVLEEALAAERAQLREAEDMALRAADQAQADATQARRELEAASAQLTREREAHAQELVRLREQFRRERDAMADRERTWNEERRQLISDKQALSQTAAHLNAECERLAAALDALTAPLPAPEVLPMPQTHAPARPFTALDAASLCAYLRQTWGRSDITWQGCEVHTPRPIPADVEAAWRQAYPTDAAKLAQLRAVVRPLLPQGVAA